MTKFLIVIMVLLSVKSLQAQVYDTYGRTQATREWQDYERNHTAGSSSNTGSKVDNSYLGGNNTPVTQWDLDRINKMFGKKAKAHIPTAEELEAKKKLEKEMAEYQKRVDNDAKRKQELQKQEDEKFAQLRDRFQQDFYVANNRNYDYAKREAAFYRMISFNDSSYRVVKKNYDYYKSSGFKDALDKITYNKNNILAHKVRFHEQQKQFNKAYHIAEDVLSQEGLNSAQKNFFLTEYIYCGLLSLKYVDDKLMEKAAYAYKLDSTKVNLFAYSLFLDKQFNLLSDLYQKHLKFNLTDDERMKYLNKLIFLNFITGNDDEAFKIYNDNSSIKINEKPKLISLIAANMGGGITKDIDSAKYLSSTLLDIEMLALLYPKSQDAQKLRQYVGKELNCERLLSPLSEIKPQKLNNKSSNTIEQLTSKGNLSDELRSVSANIGFPSYVTPYEDYKNELEALNKYCKDNCLAALKFEIENGFIIIGADKSKEKSYYRIEDLELPTINTSVVNYLIVLKLKSDKLGYGYSVYSRPNYGTREGGPNFYCDKNSQVKNTFKLFVKLFKKLQKQ
jgi:hypothetical protein